MTARVPGSSIGPLRHRDLRLLLLATTMQTVVMPIQFLSLTFWTIDSFPGRAVLYPSLVIGTRGFGMLCMALVGGAIADRFERRSVLIVTEAMTAVLTATMGVLMLVHPFGDLAIVPVLGCVLAAAALMGVDQPARAASIPSIVPAHEVAAAIGLSNVAAQLMFPVVLPLAGYLNDVLHPGEILLGSLCVWLVTLPALARLRFTSREADPAPRHLLGDIRDGLAYAAREPTTRGVIAVVFVVHVIGMPGVGALGPVWMREVLGLSPAQFGLIAMMWGLGAVAASLLVVRLHARAGRGTVLGSLALAFGAAAVVFSHSRLPVLTAGANFLLGFAMSGTMVVSSIIVQHSVANRLRGRVMGLFPLVIGLSMTNVIVVGALAQRVGLEIVFPVLSWSAISGVALVLALSGPLRAAGGAPSARAPEPVLEGAEQPGA